jgi:hypothetical protein
MYRRHVSQLRPGLVLAKAIHTERGDVLLGAGTALTQFYIDKLRDRGFISVYLQDGLGDDAEPTGIHSLQALYKDIENLMTESSNPTPSPAWSRSRATTITPSSTPSTSRCSASCSDERPGSRATSSASWRSAACSTTSARCTSTRRSSISRAS